MSQDPQETNQQQLLDFLRSHPETLAELIKEQPGILDAGDKPGDGSDHRDKTEVTGGQ